MTPPGQLVKRTSDGRSATWRGGPAALANELWLLSGVAALIFASALSWTFLREMADAPMGKEVVHAPLSNNDEPVQQIKGDFRGFSVIVDSKPAGAKVVVNGQRRGSTPTLVNMNCRTGDEISVTVKKSGFRTWKHKGECSSSSILRLMAKLRRR